MRERERKRKRGCEINHQKFIERERKEEADRHVKDSPILAQLPRQIVRFFY